MEIREKWESGLSIVVIRSDNSEKPKSYTYIDHNRLKDSFGNIVWFDEGIFPTVYTGMIIELKDSEDVKSRMYEVLSILK